MKTMYDDDLFPMMKKELFTAVIGDIMDKLGYFNQFLPAGIQPLRSDMVTVGRAMPVLEADRFMDEKEGSQDPNPFQPFGLMLEALDDLKKNEVYVCTGASPKYALWGHLMSARAIRCGAVGAVLDGYIRDTLGILDLGFPTFAYGSYAQDQAPRGQVVDFRIPIKLNNVVVNPGDILFGDVDGVCVIPQAVEKEVIDGALEKARGEKTVLKAIQQGMSARDAFDKYNIM